MRTINKTAQRTLDALTAGLVVGEARTLDAAPDAYMSLHVERISETCYSLAHYYKQNGDLVPDPEGVFFRSEIGWLPVELTQCTGRRTVALTIEGGQPDRFNPRAIGELASFANMWLKNVRQQQGVRLPRK